MRPLEFRWAIEVLVKGGHIAAAVAIVESLDPGVQVEYLRDFIWPRTSEKVEDKDASGRPIFAWVVDEWSFLLPEFKMLWEYLPNQVCLRLKDRCEEDLNAS